MVGCWPACWRCVWLAGVEQVWMFLHLQPLHPLPQTGHHPPLPLSSVRRLGMLSRNGFTNSKFWLLKYSITVALNIKIISYIMFIVIWTSQREMQSSTSHSLHFCLNSPAGVVEDIITVIPSLRWRWFFFYLIIYFLFFPLEKNVKDHTSFVANKHWLIWFLQIIISCISCSLIPS